MRIADLCPHLSGTISLDEFDSTKRLDVGELALDQLEHEHCHFLIYGTLEEKKSPQSVPMGSRIFIHREP